MYENDDGQMVLFEEEHSSENIDDFAEFREVANKQFEAMRNQGIEIGIKISSRVILDKIASAMNKPGKRSLNDYRRLIKEIVDFCNVSMKSQDETVQN